MLSAKRRDLAAGRSGLRSRGLGSLCLFCGRSGSPAILPTGNFILWDTCFPFFHPAGWPSVPPGWNDFWYVFGCLFNHWYRTLFLRKCHIHASCCGELSAKSPIFQQNAYFSLNNLHCKQLLRHSIHMLDMTNECAWLYRKKSGALIGDWCFNMHSPVGRDKGQCRQVLRAVHQN